MVEILYIILSQFAYKLLIYSSQNLQLVCAILTFIIIISFSQFAYAQTIADNDKQNLTHLIYENSEIGIKLQYPLIGNIGGNTIYFNSSIDSGLTIMTARPISGNLIDEMKDVYFQLIKPNFKYINDNQTIFSDRPALQMEYYDGDSTNLLIMTQNGDTHYTFHFKVMGKI